MRPFRRQPIVRGTPVVQSLSPKEEAGEVVDRPAEDTPAEAGLSAAHYASVSVAAGVLFVVLTLWVSRHTTVPPGFDERIHRWVVVHRTPASATVARAVTWGGVTTVVLPVLIGVGAMVVRSGTSLRRRAWAGVLLAGVASVGVFVGLQINAFVGRARPPVADWAGTAGGPAFPSGHTTAATFFALSCAAAIAARSPAEWRRRVVWGTAVAVAAAVGWSRVWLGVHWPTDVLGGWLYATAWFTGTTAAILVLRARRIARRS